MAPRPPGVRGGPMIPPNTETPANEGPWTHHRIRKGAQLARAGLVSVSLFVVNEGCFRVSMPGGAAQGRVLDFAMRGNRMSPGEREALSESAVARVRSLPQSTVLTWAGTHDFEAALRGEAEEFGGVLARYARLLADLRRQEGMQDPLPPIGRQFIVALDRAAHMARDDRGDTYRYRKLLLATGATPRKLSFGGERVIHFRALDDYLALRRFAVRGAHIGVIGGGFIGSELAASLATKTFLPSRENFIAPTAEGPVPASPIGSGVSFPLATSSKCG